MKKSEKTIYQDETIVLQGLRRCKVISLEEMQQMNTHCLMAIRKVMLSLEESVDAHNDGGKNFWNNDVLSALEKSECRT